MDETGTGTRILVVQDDLDIAEVLQELFRTAGYEVAIAYDAPAALTQAASFLPQVVLLDIQMQTTDGYELCSQLSALQNRLFRIIALTSDVRLEVTQLCAAGFDGRLLKPIDFERALRLLEQLGSPDPRGAPSSRCVEPGA